MSETTSEITYEFVTEAPVEAIVGLYEAGGWWRESAAARAAIPGMIAGSMFFLLARTRAEVVGMGRVISDGVSDGYVQDVVVLPVFRGRGIGRELVRRLTARCREAGLLWIGLVAEPGTRGFYEPLGYRVREGFELMLHPGGEDGR